MSEPTSFTQEAIRDFMVFRGGKVTNHELVKHFKKFLTNPATQEEARVLFKEYVNNLATITRDPDGGKQLVLKKRYRTPSIDQSFNISGLPATPLSPTTPLSPSPLSPLDTPTLNLRYQPVYQSSYELDLGSPHRSPYRRLSSESLSPSYSLRSPGTPTSSYSAQFPPSSGYQQLVTPLGYVSPAVLHNPLQSGSVYHQEPPIGIPTGPAGMPSPSRMVPLAPTPLGKQNPSPSLPSIPSSVGVPTSPITPLGIPHSSSASNITATVGSQHQFKPAQSPMIHHNYQGPIRRQSSSDSVFTDPPTTRECDPPPVPPRRRSSDKSLTKLDLKELEDFRSKASGSSATQSTPTSPTQELTPMDTKTDDNKENVAEDSKISVKERMQKFDRMASESALMNKTTTTSSLHTNLFKKRQEKERDEEDTGSVTLIDATTREWLVKCAQGDYQAMVKMAAENPRLIKFKDTMLGYTALHWGAKHGNEDIIKLVAGKYGAHVNARSNGGYTPLHIAMQYGHDECYNLLVEVYGADPNIRDYSGKKPRQYQTNKGTSVSVDTFRKIKAMKKHAAEKDLGFLRIGSLNVRVKRTTEAFSHFLGVGNPEKLHKHWGSADNLHQGDNKRMPPPKFAPIKKRKSKRAHDFGVPIRAQSLIEKPVKPEQNNQDSDSDTAAGFGSQWQSTV